MNHKTKIEKALKALDRHVAEYKEQGYEPIIPQRLKDFWKTGEAFKYDKLCLPADTELDGWEESSIFRLYLVAPMWDNMLLALDDGVVGPIGDWDKAYNYLPIFVGGVQGDFCIVVKLDDPKCPVGMFEEASCGDEDEGMIDGVAMLAPSLDVFLATLTDLDADVDMELDEDMLEEAYLSQEEY